MTGERNDPTTGELAILINGVKDAVTGLTTRIDAFVLREVYAADKLANEARIQSIQDAATGAKETANSAIGQIRAVFGLLCTAIIGAIVTLVIKAAIG